MTAVTSHGTFTGDLSWLDSAPPRCEWTFSQACDVLRLAIAGEPLPYQDVDPQRLLSDVHLIGMNETTRQRQRAEHAEATGADTRRATAAVWTIVTAAYRRKTLRTDDVRAALQGDR